MNAGWMEQYKDKMLKMTLTTLKDGRERHIAVCKEPDGSLSTTRTCVGTKCYVTLKECRGRLVGDFHTHPGAPPDPSHFDFYGAYNRGMDSFCIGSGNASDLPPKTRVVSGKTVLTHALGWSREGIPQVDCFKMGRREFVAEWLKKHGIRGDVTAKSSVKGRWTMAKHLETGSAKKLEGVFYNAVWFHGEYLREPLLTKVKTFKGVRT